MARPLLVTGHMHTIRPDHLDLVTGGAAPSPARPSSPSGGGANNLADWLPSNAADIRPADNRAFTNPPNPSFQTRTPMVTSSPDQSWQRGLDGMFSQLGM